MLTTIC